MVQMLQPDLSATFTDYAQTVVMPYNIRQQSIKYTRIDIVYDVYYKISIKNATREKHGRGFRYTVTGQGKIPKDWKAFLNFSENKIELFAFLTDVVTHMLTCPILVHLIMRRQTPGCSSMSSSTMPSDKDTPML